MLEFGRYPDEMIDPNIKVDYGKLRHLIVIDKRLNGNFSRLKAIQYSAGYHGYGFMLMTRGTEDSRLSDAIPVNVSTLQFAL